MNTLIVFSTKYGCTEKCANILAEKLQGNVDLYNLKVPKNIELSQYDKVIIGGSIYIGKIQQEVNEFCVKNLDRLLEKKVGLFICCMREDETAAQELDSSFPKDLVDNAVAKEYFGGEFSFKKMNFLDRLITKKVANVNEDTSNILNENINRFVQTINSI